MTKREYLERLGYLFNKAGSAAFKHECNGSFECTKVIIEEADFYCVDVINQITFDSQKDIDKLQIAFNNVKRDFEEMQKYGD